MRETLTQIVAGVTEAQQSVIEGAKINPRIRHLTERIFIVEDSEDYYDIAQTIKFDIAITTNMRDKANGGVGIFVSGLGIGIKGEDEQINENVNRISFEVPVTFPFQK
jgi:hypothetical protein